MAENIVALRMRVKRLESEVSGLRRYTRTLNGRVERLEAKIGFGEEKVITEKMLRRWSRRQRETETLKRS